MSNPRRTRTARRTACRTSRRTARAQIVRVARARTRLALALTPIVLCALALGACGDTIQDQPIARSSLEPLIGTQHNPVYWLGSAFRNLAITEAAHDPGGAYTLRYGDCTVGGQYTCVTPLSIVTSPDNSFLPGPATARRELKLRGVRGVVAQQGATIEIATGGVVVEIQAENPRLARAAAQAMTPINRAGLPGAPLPPPLPDTGFAATPLAAQLPPGARLPGR
ncbi:MAG TPA: hypothetical protein VID29_02530 [Solirubrobacteraceae bacterium]